MGRMAGVANRRWYDKVDVLREWLRRQAVQQGCGICGGTERLTFRMYRDSGKSLSRLPNQAGMTLRELRKKVRDAVVVCRGCARGALSGYPCR